MTISTGALYSTRGARARVGVLVLLAASCGSEGSPPAGSSSGSAGAPGSSGRVEAAAPKVFGPLWARAEKSGDPLDHAELGRAEGAAGLIAGLSDPEHGGAARAALVTVPDAPLAFAVLASRLRAGEASAPEDGATLLAILGRGPVLGERLDPEGEQAAVEDLLAVAADASAPRERRALAVSALRRMVAWGIVAEGRIPTDLDG